MFQIYNQFYRETGVRRFSELLSPRLAIFRSFPRNSVYHHLNDDGELFPDPSKPYFQGYGKRLPIELVYRSDQMLGHPREVPFTPSKFTIPFVRQHRLFRFVARLIDAAVDERTLSVVDYNPLKFTYRYIHTPISDLQKWESNQRTMWANINEQAKQSSKQHFVMIEPLKDIPSYSLLTQYSTKDGMSLARLFNTSDRLFVLHLANFIRPETRERSVMNVLDKKILNHVNLLFMLKDGRCSTINLAYLFNWIKGDEPVGDVNVAQQHADNVVIRGLLKYFLVISSAVPEYAIDHAPEQATDDESENETEHDELPKVSEEQPHHPLVNNVQSRLGTPPKEKQQNTVQEIKILEPEPEMSQDIIKSLDEDLEILERKNHYDLHQRGITLKDKEVIEVHPEQTTYTHEEVHQEVHTNLTPNDALHNKLKIALEKGDLNAAGFKKAEQDAAKYAKMPDPYGTNKSILERTKVIPEALKIKPQEIELKDHKTVLDKSMNKSTLQVFTTDYVKNHLHNDVLKSVGALQKGGVIVQRHEITYEHSVMGSAELHNLEIKPVNGAASSIWFRLPVIAEDGTFSVAGNKYLMRKQRVDLPIRKISSTEVSLSSYYGKSFVSTENKVSNSASAWLLKQIENASFNGSEWISDVVPGDTFDSYAKVPYIYGLLSTRFISFKAGDLSLTFDGTDIRTTPQKGSLIAKRNMKFCGFGPNKSHVYIDMNDQFFLMQDDDILTNIGDIYRILNLNPHDSPVRYSELALFRKNVPVGVVMGYRLGWSKLLALLKVTPRIVSPRQRLNLQLDEYPIVFANGTYVFSRKDALATMILAGFMDYSKITKSYDIKDFEHPSVYLNLLTSKGLGAIYIREIDMLFDYFVDPITQEILEDMKEPTTFEGLLIRSSELLMTYYHPKSQDGAYTRIRGYERMAGAVYRELTASVRAFRSKNIAGKSKVDISPYKVWQSINEDPTKMMVPDINPLQDLKNDESVTYVGEGGRSSDGINKASRSFHEQDVGIISEGTVDSSDVGVNIYTSSNPLIKNHRGLKDMEHEKIETTNRHCSAVLLAPGAIHDDQNRINFIQVQASHCIPATGYHPSYVRTGYESVIAQRMNPMFAYCAKEDGQVIKVNDKGIILEYKSGKKIGVETGRVFGRSEGSIFPFHIESAVTEGKNFKKGDPIAYNTAYFEYDTWNPGQLVLKNSLTAKTLLWETKQTHEDASSISKKLSNKLGTTVTYARNFVIAFEQNIHHVVKLKQELQPQDILMSIEDEITSNLGSFGDSAIETLKGLSKQSPRSNYFGTVDRIEVFYHGDKDQMSPSLRKLADLSDHFIAEQAKATNKPKYTGRVNNDYRVEGTPLGLDHAEIRFYITVNTNMGVADKVVFANQMKSVNSEVMDYKLHTEAGEEIDAVFGCRSIAARNVMSPYIVGTTITLLKLFAQNAVKLFNSEV